MTFWSVPRSRCSDGVALNFVWFGDPPQGETDAVEAATTAFEAFMRQPPFVWNPYSWPLAKKEFSSRLKVAMRGELEPVDQVAYLASGKKAYLYEIRWTFDVCELTDDQGRAFTTIEVRLYHSEPSQLPDAFVGLHVHRKQIVTGDTDATNDLQNAEIRIAAGRYAAGLPSLWGRR